MTPRNTLLLLCLLCCMAACQRRQASDSGVDDEQLRQRMDALQTELQSIQKELSSELERSRRGTGRGAYAQTPYSIVGTETILERLHRTEENLALARTALDDKTRSIIALQQENNDQTGAIADLSAKAERLDRAEASRITAIQERNATLSDFEELRQRLVAAELARLERERDYYDLVTEIIRLDPGHTQDFFALQQRMKDQARNLPKPADLEQMRKVREDMKAALQ